MVTFVLMVAVPEAAGVLIFATLGVFGVAVLYEVLRSVGTGPVPDESPPRSRLASWRCGSSSALGTSSAA